MKISVIIPTSGRLDPLAKCLSKAMHAAAAFRRPAVVLLGKLFSSASQHHLQWGYPETLVLGCDEDHPDIFSPEEAREKVREVLSDA